MEPGARALLHANQPSLRLPAALPPSSPACLPPPPRALLPPAALPPFQRACRRRRPASSVPRFPARLARRWRVQPQCREALEALPRAPARAPRPGPQRAHAVRGSFGPEPVEGPPHAPETRRGGPKSGRSGGRACTFAPTCLIAHVEQATRALAGQPEVGRQWVPERRPQIGTAGLQVWPRAASTHSPPSVLQRCPR